MPPSSKGKKKELKKTFPSKTKHTHTLTSLFSKQKLLNSAKAKSTFVDSDDDDFVEITKVESKSKFFQKNEKSEENSLDDKCSEPEYKAKSRRLSLKKLSSKIHEKTESELSSSATLNNSHVIVLTDSPIKDTGKTKRKLNDKTSLDCESDNSSKRVNKSSSSSSRKRKLVDTLEDGNTNITENLKRKNSKHKSDLKSSSNLSILENNDIVTSLIDESTRPKVKKNSKKEFQKPATDLDKNKSNSEESKLFDSPKTNYSMKEEPLKSKVDKDESNSVSSELTTCKLSKLNSVSKKQSLKSKVGDIDYGTSSNERLSEADDVGKGSAEKKRGNSNGKRNKKLGEDKPNAQDLKGKESADEVDGPQEEDTEETEYKIPYYLENFQTILKSVLEDESYVKLFNEKDLKIIELFNNLSEEGQKLFVRLFSRKLQWINCEKLKYPKIAEDLTDVIQELLDVGFLSSESDLNDLEETLKILAAPDLKTLAKSYHVSTVGVQKTEIIDILLKKTKQNTITSLFGGKGGITQAMLNKAKKHAGRCIKLRAEERGVFVRVLLLFSTTTFSLDEEGTISGQNQLFQMLMVNIGRVVYPTYSINKQTHIYTDRQSVLLYEKALQLEADFISCVERSKWEEAYQLYLVVKQEYHDLPVENTRYDAKLPDFLRRYTTGHLYIRMLSQGIEILQRRRDYHGAIDLIQLLLKQDVYCFDYHGYWWERLALNLDAHLKNPIQALETVKKGLADGNVRVGHRLALYQRAEKICQTASLKLKHRLTEFYHEEVIEAPKTTIEGRTIPYAVPGIKYKFMTQDSYSTDNPDDVTMCNVEQVVLDYYKDHDYPEGLHAEGSIISTLFTLFFWDILFLDVPDAFHSLYQTNPLDKMSEEFYRRRKDEIDDRLQWLDNSSIEDLEARSSDTWNKYNETTCAGINWERLQSLEYIQGLIQCIGGKLLCGLLSRYAKDPRHTRSGFPDLTLWNTENKTFKIVEVKGPGDRLSHKQILWLSYLCKLGIDAEVCHVKAVGVKKLKAKPSNGT